MGKFEVPPCPRTPRELVSKLHDAFRYGNVKVALELGRLDYGRNLSVAVDAPLVLKTVRHVTEDNYFCMEGYEGLKGNARDHAAVEGPASR